MTTDEIIKTLKEYNKWRKGKGRKYSQPGFPFDEKRISETIDAAILRLSKRMDRDDFIVMSGIVEKSVADRRTAKCRLSDDEKKAVRSMRKIVTYLDKSNG